MPGLFEDLLETDKHTVLTPQPGGKYKVEQKRLSRSQLEAKLEEYVNASAEIAEMLEFLLNKFGLRREDMKELMSIAAHANL